MELLGVYDHDLLEPMARVLSNLGVKRAMVVYGQDCLDEISMSAPTSVCEARDGRFESFVIEPEQFGFTRCGKEELTGGTPADNARITRDIFEGAKGPKRDAVILNSAAAIHIARPELSLKDAAALAQETIDSGKAREQLERFIRLSSAEDADAGEGR
jgi:anthranilate phosphoribosyltransferase